MQCFGQIIFLFTILIVSCNDSNKIDTKGLNTASEIEKYELQSILDSSKIEGAILIYDKQVNTYYSNDFKESQKRYLPASTYKIPNSIIGLELGILADEKTVFKWDGNDRTFSIWEKDLTLKEAFQTSCLPCYQELAREIGTQRMRENIEKLRFGRMDINKENIDNFWLIGNSTISPFEQIDFLIKLYEEQLPISKFTCQTVKSIMEIETTNEYTLSGKTGLAIGGEKDVGWFVGYVKKDSNIVYIVTVIRPKDVNIKRNKFMRLRKSITDKALKKLNIIE